MLTDKDFTVTFFDVNGGDGIWVRYKDENKKFHNILIDGGYGKSYHGAFKQVISKIVEKTEEQIDLWIITHIDGDHIGAILAFIKDSDFKEKDKIVGSFWFNHTNFEVPNLSSSVSVNQAIKLRKYLEDLGIVEQSFVDITTPIRTLQDVTFQILSPSPEKRVKANDEWLLEERSKLSSGTKTPDHGKTIEELKANVFEEDGDIPNGSSIAFILTYHAFSGLFLADSHPSDIIAALKSLGYSPQNKLTVNFVKVAHHGSKVNTNDELLSLIDCENYVFSANGISHYHPDKEVLVRVITQASRNLEIQRVLSFVIQNDTIRDLFKVDDQAGIKHNFTEVYPEKGDNYLQITYDI